MRSTATDATAIGRRALLWGAAVGFGLTLAPGLTRARTRLLVSTARLPDGRFGVVALEPDGTLRFATPLPGRGHEPVVARGRGEIVVMARRPGRFLAVVGLADGALRRSLSAPRGRHFYGHAVFDAAGRLLYTTENDYDGGRGVIGVWDVAAGYVRVGELDAHGIGPHDLALGRDGRTLAIANGGLLTHPGSGRAKLNLASMEPCLTVLDPTTGEALRRLVLPKELHQLSIRHLAIAPDGGIGFGMQYEGPLDQGVPLAGIWAPDGTVTLMPQDSAPPAVTRNYVGDLAIDATGRYLAASYPRGDGVGVWDLRRSRTVGLVRATDACGLAVEDGTDRLWISDGTGAIGPLDAGRSLMRDTLVPVPGLAFDNHFARI
ncbi:MAG: DUF1513 domain-containing protein [Thalassobaculum sp.]|uniref:DUF1513 domain-containing protein n=1 Tax=Thalassobaculum sp. TaxID=2022740 RepID=UPI0032F08A10